MAGAMSVAEASGEAERSRMPTLLSFSQRVIEIAALFSTNYRPLLPQRARRLDSAAGHYYFGSKHARHEDIPEARRRRDIRLGKNFASQSYFITR